MAEAATEYSASKYVELLPLEKSKSPVWSYFGFLARDGGFIEKDKKKRQTVYCKLCNHGLSYNGNTTNMLVHLQYKHKEKYTAVTSKATLDTGVPSQSVQHSMTAVFQQLSPISRSSSRWKALTDSVCFCIAKDMLPYDTVTDLGFRHMLHTFEPRCVPPDRTTIARHYMPLLYEREKAKVTSAMASGLQHFAVTSDGWSSRANHSYVC